MVLIVIYTVTIIIVFLAGLYVGKKWGVPFLKKEREYSIGIYTGASPFDLSESTRINNPVLRAVDVTDIHASFVADPFMVQEQGFWYMFFEVMIANINKGVIGLAVSQDGFHWQYKQIVLDEPFHLSYPHVFKWNGDYYMLPESCEAYAVRLYKAVEFPHKWELVKALIVGNYFDSSVLYYSEKWWIFTSDRNDILHLFNADDLLGPWKEHPKSPIILGNGHIARPSGRVVLFNNKVIRFTQDCVPDYGYQVLAFEVTELSTRHYKEQQVSEKPVLKPTGKGWNAERMHHIDLHEVAPNQWLACVDGVGGKWKFRFR